MNIIDVNEKGALVTFNSIDELYDVGSDLLELLRNERKDAYSSAREFEKCIYKLYLALETSGDEEDL